MAKDSGNVDKGLSFFKRAEESVRTAGEAKMPGICKAGQKIDEYTLVKRLGRGGMGEVWEAVQESLNRTVALKVLLPGGGIREFAREARAGARLNHPGIVAVYDTGESDGIPWIAMELVEGAFTLGDFIQEMRAETELPEDYYPRVATFMAQTAEALDVAHKENVIHRDLKPMNILISEADEPKVGDFGLARLVDEMSISQTGDFAGTYYYMSPEQVAAKRTGLDHRTDIFSLGVVFYELLSLQRPFEGDTTQQIAHKVMVVDPPNPQILRSRVPSDLCVVAGKAMEKDPDRRYQTMEEFAADIRRHLSDEPIKAQPPTLLQRTVKWAKRNPVKSVSGGVATAALVLISLLWLRAVDAEKETAAALELVEAEKIATEVERDRAGEERDRAKQAEQFALDAEQAAREAEQVAKQSAYSASIHAAGLALESGNHAESRRRLEACSEELRGWEWFHLALSQDPSLRTLIGHERGVSAVAWSPDGVRIASGSHDQILRVWVAETGEILYRLQHQGRVTSVAWGPSGREIASGSYDGTIRIWDVETGENLRTFKVPGGLLALLDIGPGRDRKAVVSLDWSADGRHIAARTGDGQLRVWDAWTGKILRSLEGERSYPVATVAWDPLGRRVASGMVDNRLEIWDGITGESIKISGKYASDLRSLSWSPDGLRIATGHFNPEVHLWDVETGELVQILEGHEGIVRSLAWSPDGRWIASGSYDSTVRVWDAETGEGVNIFKGYDDQSCVAWSPSSRQLVAGSSDGTLRIWDIATAGSMQTLQTVSYPVSSVAWSPNGARLVSTEIGRMHTVGGIRQDDVRGSRVLRIWDAETGEFLRSLEGHDDWVQSAAWNPLGTRIVSGSLDKTLRIWDVATGVCLRTLEGHQDGVQSVAWHPDGGRIASAAGDSYSRDRDHTIRIWDGETGEHLSTLWGHGDDVKSLAWSPDGNQILSGSDDNTVRIWDLESGENVKVMKGHQGDVLSVVWSPDGRRIASGSDDYTLRIWDAETGESLRVLEGHTSTVNSVAWSGDGRRIVSGAGSGAAADSTIRVWDAETGEPLLRLKGHEYRVTSVAWSPDGTRIASGSHDQTLRIWESQLEEAAPMWQAAADRRLAEFEETQDG